MNRWSWLLVAIACVLLFVSLRDRGGNQRPDAVALGLAGEPDLRMEKAEITQYDEAGAVRYRLWSEEIRHFESEAQTHLASPTLTLDRAPQPPWLASAKQGIVKFQAAADGKLEEVVLLSEGVHLQHGDAASRIDVTCPTLTIYPDRRFAETDQPVMISSDSGSTVAVGFSGDLNSGRIKLSSKPTQRVHTVVLPGQFKRAATQTPR
jgi:LPS export ABC transporter protein LptC